MLDDDLPVFAVHGEGGIDLFHRIDDANRRRARYRCVATLRTDGALRDHAPEARRDPAALRAVAEGLAADPLARALSLADPQGWPGPAEGADPIRLFLYLDFLRAWQVAELAGARLESQLARDSAALPTEPGLLASAISPVFDFNRLGRGVRLARIAAPLLAARVTQAGFSDDKHGGTGYALRMLGDLCLRAGDPAQALACFETALLAGDNPFRRRKAIEAARTARDAGAAARHRAAFAERWALPADLAETGDPV